MYVIWVEFEVKAQKLSEFVEAVTQNARLSLLEPGCHQFDVCVSTEKEAGIALYEIYDDEAAFDVHLKTKHFSEFNDAVSDWVLSKRVVAYERIEDDSAQ
ncbi:putative quinol monooxygenase [Aestuariirhabdus sp. LZHN29]|uniref:putative quinol monooxygenase n=1 Tax=Aestuariirhabdus sp. LZHN29 TaxID=3417462 RepID=UPI003CF66B03